MTIYLKPRGSYLDYPLPPEFSDQTLIGNWFERRYGYQEKGNCILPGMGSIQGCEKHLTTTQESYTNEHFHGVEPIRYFQSMKLQRFENRLENGSHIELSYAEDMKRNWTTTHTLQYDIVPKLRYEQCLKTAHLNELERLSHMPELDMLESFGNSTVTGIRKRKRCEQLLENAKRMKTTYASSYNRK